MEQFEKVCNGLETIADNMPKIISWEYGDLLQNTVGTIECALALIRQQQERIKAQDEVIRALRKVGYPHNFQREPTWIVNYMYAITDVIKKAVKLE